MRSERKCGIYTIEYCVYTHTHTYFKAEDISFKKEENSVIWDNMDKSRGHYVMWNKIRQAQKNKYSTISLICEI